MTTPTRAIPILLFALVWLSVAWFGSWHWNPNSAVRMFAAVSIVEQGDATIDQFEHLTIDKARFDGAFYMDKAPGMTLMALAPVALANWADGQTSAGLAMNASDPALDRFMRLRVWLAAAMTNAILLGFASVALFDLGTRATGSAAAGLFGALAFALGTPLWGWSTTLFGHAAVASLLAVAIWLIERGSREGSGGHSRHALLAGLALGWALVIEHTALLFALPIGLWALWRWRVWPPRDRNRAIVDTVLAGVLAMLPLLAYNIFALGDPFRLGYQGVVGFEGMQQGLFGLTAPKLEVLGEIVWGERRGMLWVAPILAVAPIGLLLAWRRGMRDVVILAVAGGTIAFLYNASYFYWDGGNSTGPRHAMPAIAFLALGLAPLWAAAGALVRIALAALLTLSAGINLTIAAAEITAPHDVVNGLIDGVWRARFLPGYLRTVPNEWFGYTPWQGLAMYLAVAAMLLIAIVYRLRADANIYRTDGAARHS